MLHRGVNSVHELLLDNIVHSLFLALWYGIGSHYNCTICLAFTQLRCIAALRPFFSVLLTYVANSVQLFLLYQFSSLLYQFSPLLYPFSSLLYPFSSLRYLFSSLLYSFSSPVLKSYLCHHQCASTRETNYICFRRTQGHNQTMDFETQ